MVPVRDRESLEEVFFGLDGEAGLLRSIEHLNLLSGARYLRFNLKVTHTSRFTMFQFAREETEFANNILGLGVSCRKTNASVEWVRNPTFSMMP